MAKTSDADPFILSQVIYDASAQLCFDPTNCKCDDHGDENKTVIRTRCF